MSADALNYVVNHTRRPVGRSGGHPKSKTSRSTGVGASSSFKQHPISRFFFIVAHFLCKSLLPKWRVVKDSAITRLGFVQTTMLPIKPFSSSSVTDELQESFTVSYLINSCGLPLETAISASQKVHFETPEKPDSVLTLLKDHGFTNTHITSFIRAHPKFLVADPEKTLLPKLKFLFSISVSRSDIVKLLSSNPYILNSSLENHIIPRYNFLKSLHLDDKYVVKTMCMFFNYDVQKRFAPNISVLREHGVPESFILLTIKCYLSALLLNRDKFDKIVKEVIEIGYNPKKAVFVQAVYAFCSTTKSTREHRMEVYRSWGWSEDDVRLMFKKHPFSITLSDKKLMSTMDFLVNKMGYQLDAIARYPLVFGFSLEKRVIPRCLVIKVLRLKGLLKGDLSFSTFMKHREKHFQDKFITKYQEDVPQLLNVYQGKMSLLELGFGSEEICGMKQL